MVFCMVGNFLFQLFDAYFCLQSRFVIFFCRSFFLFRFFSFDFMFYSVHICYWMLGCQMSSCHIDQVNRFIRQAPLWNVLDRIVNRCLQDFIRQDDIVVFFVKVTDPLENLKGILCRRRIDLDFVETTSQSRILQDGVAVFVLGRCPNYGQFPT